MKSKANFFYSFLITGLLVSTQSHGADPVTAERQIMQLESDVQGQRSQPKVLFILPWEENVDTNDIEIDDSLISEEDFLAPIDRVVFQHTINMYEQLDNSQ